MGAVQQILNAAFSAVGVMYQWGGNSLRTGVDCSGLVQQAFASVGVSLPRVSAQQATTGRRLTQQELRPGDLISWDTGPRNNGADHIAIYIGNGQMIEAPGKGKPVRVVPIVTSGATYTRVPQLEDGSPLLRASSFSPLSAFNGYGGSGVQAPRVDAGGGAGGGGTTQSGAVGGGQQNPVTKIPSDAQLFNVRSSSGAVTPVVAFNVGGTRIYYHVGSWSQVSVGGRTPTTITSQQFHAGGSVMAGQATELGTMATEWGTYKAFWNHLLDTVFAADDPARSDPGVLKVIAEFAARPDMSPEELENKLRSTTYWKNRTDRQREWNELSPKEQQFQIKEWQTRLAEEHFNIFGRRIDPNDPRIVTYATQVASGVLGQSALIAKWQSSALEAEPESPYARKIRDEQEAQRQRGVDIENRREAVRQLANRWGVRMSDQALDEWGRGIIENTKSEEDLLNHLRQSSQVLYAWKPPEMETADAAAPWIQAYERVMEKPTDLFNEQVQAALTAGQPVYEFERELKRRPEWQETKNFDESLQRTAGTVSQLMGFT